MTLKLSSVSDVAILNATIYQNDELHKSVKFCMSMSNLAQSQTHDWDTWVHRGHLIGGFGVCYVISIKIKI